jgi:flavin reductase
VSTTISKQAFREAMSDVCAAVNIVTTDGPAGRGGFTATAMCSVSDDPALLLICMNRNSAQSALFIENKRFCVNVLTDSHTDLAGYFAGGLQDMDARYAAADWTELQTNCPVLKDALINFDCELETVHEAGSHNIMIGRVVGLSNNAGANALAYYKRTFLNPALALQPVAVTN